jgi:hypothetical protein
MQTILRLISESRISLVLSTLLPQSQSDRRRAMVVGLTLRSMSTAPGFNARMDYADSRSQILHRFIRLRAARDGAAPAGLGDSFLAKIAAPARHYR